MRFEVDASSSDDYGDFATVRIIFDDDSWLEIDAADAHDMGGPRHEHPFTTGAKVTRHNADGTEDIVWNGYVMPQWYAKRLAAQHDAQHEAPDAAR